MATVTARRRRAIEHLVATDLARARLARAAFDAVADGLDLGPCALRTAADRAWIQVAIAGPIQQAADHALARLVDDLIEALSRGDPNLVARLLGNPPDADIDDAAGSQWLVMAMGPDATSRALDSRWLAERDEGPARAAVLR